MTRKRGAALGILLIVLAFGWATFRVLQAKGHLTQAKAHLAAARQALVDRNLDRAKGEIALAGKQTRQARGETDDPVVTVVAHIPLLGREVHVVRGISTAADDIARQVLPAGVDLSTTLDPKKLRAPDGTIDVQALNRAQPVAASLKEKMTAVADDVHNLPGGIGPIKTARKDFTAEVDKLAKIVNGANDAVIAAPPFLGGDQPRRWFVFVQQFAESRGTGGIIGGYAVLRADKGKLTVEQQGSNADLKDVHVAGKSVNKQFHDRYDLSGAFDVWVNINLSPDLPQVAKLVNEKWQAQGGKPLDGVITVDPRSLALLLRDGQPIALPDRTTLAPEKIEQYLTTDQYRNTSGEPGNQGQRKDALAAVAKQVLDRVTGGQSDSTALVKGMVAAVQSGHLHMATVSPIRTLDDVLGRDGLDGALPKGSAPVAYAVINNASASKIDQFLVRKVTYAGEACHGDRRKTTITVELTNNAPPISTLPPYVSLNSAGDHTIHTTTNDALLEVYGTRDAVLTSASLNGEAVSSVQGLTSVRLEIASEDDRPVWQVLVKLPPGQAQRLVLDLSEPQVDGVAKVPDQPLSNPLRVAADLPAC